MKFCFKGQHVVLMLMSISVPLFPLLSYAGGYFITDREGKVLSEDLEKVTVISSSEERIVFTDKRDRRVFEAEWDASNKKLIVRGDNVYLQIYSTGRIEKLTTLSEDETKQMPIIIEPIVPLSPRKNASPQK